MVIMPELRARAERAIRDGRGWGRYAGTVLVGRMQAGVQRKAAIITVYAPCGASSAATVRQRVKELHARDAGSAFQLEELLGARAALT